MNKKLISIIVPIYNVEQYLDRCMQSLLNQTYENIEIIMVDDESPDNCPQMCDEYAKKDSRVKVIHKKNEGLGLARNSGFDIAKGEYIAFVDSDDYVTENMCEILMESAERNQADIVYGGIYHDSMGKIDKLPCVEEETVWSGKEEVKNLLLDFIATKPNEKKDTIMEVSVWKALFRKSIFDQAGIRFVSERKFISEDVIFNIDYMLNAKCVVAVPNCIYYYCVNPKSLSKTFRTDRFEKEIVLYDEIARKIKGHYLSEEIELRLGRFLIARARVDAKQIIRHRSVIGNRAVKEGLDKIVNCEQLRCILEEYPILKLPKKYFVVAFLMKYKIRWGINLILK